MKKIINFFGLIIKNIIKIISDACFIVLFFYGVTFIPFLLGYKALAIPAGNTVYSEGTLIYYDKSVKLEQIRVSDRILVKKDKTYIFYTVNDVVDDTIYVGDTEINYKDVHGKIAPVSVPYFGYFVRFMNNNSKVFYLLIAIVVADIILGNIVNSIKNIKSRPKEEKLF